MVNKNIEKKCEGYSVALDPGTNSLGVAAIDSRYRPLKYHGRPIMVTHIFPKGETCKETRAHRTARRRKDRCRERISMTNEIFAAKIAAVDPDFFIRKRESDLWKEDKSTDSLWSLFADPGYSDVNYYREYPTIHHLICALINDKNKKFDLRLIVNAIDWLMANRGHFLLNINSENIKDILDFTRLYNEFKYCFDARDESMPWDAIDPEELGKILKMRSVKEKRNALIELLYQGNIPNDDYFINKKALIGMLAGGNTKPAILFPDSDYSEDYSFHITDDMEEVLPDMGDNTDIIAAVAAMYDWSLLSDLLDPQKYNSDKEYFEYISEAKVAAYDLHKQDLKNLKAFVKKYEKAGVLSEGTYNTIFKASGKNLKNYTAYSYNTSSVPNTMELPDGKAKKEEFYSFLKSILSYFIPAKSSKKDGEEGSSTVDEGPICINVEPEDISFFEDMLRRMELGTFMPKQVTGDNSLIPHQLYLAELKAILNNAVAHYPFLNTKDQYGYTNIHKLISIFKFKIPYYVGPLASDEISEHAWMERKTCDKITPWNFNEVVDLDKSEQNFISRLINKCTYIPGEYVVPKNSLLYTEFMVLNEINNIKVDGDPIPVEAKQGIYNELFMKKRSVSPSSIYTYLWKNGYADKESGFSGLDKTVKSNLRPWHDFKQFLDDNTLSREQVERIIERRTCTNDKKRFKEWLEASYPFLKEDDIEYISKLSYKDFGRLSKRFLCDVIGEDKKTKEKGSIIDFLWNTNDNMMKLLSEKYSFVKEVKKIKDKYYNDYPHDVEAIMEDARLSNTARRTIYRTLDVIDDIVSTVKHDPDEFYIEASRDDPTIKATKKGKRTKTRLETLKELYKKADIDTTEFEQELDDLGDKVHNLLQNDKVYLYFLQLGRCIYTGERINFAVLSKLNQNEYNEDHIYPDSKSGESALWENMVLCTRNANHIKNDNYPINPEIQKKMYGFWKLLCNNGLMRKEKFERLMRKTPFTNEEKLGFINSQLVETRQSIKVLVIILKTLYPNTKVVTVKAGLIDQFRQRYLSSKVRSINDLHHAKDAYLIGVVGRVYYERFSPQYFSINRDFYSLKIKNIYENNIIHDGNVIWDAKNDLETIKKVYSHNDIHLTRYAYCADGEFSNLMPSKKTDKSSTMMERKQGRDISKYGGYNNLNMSFFYFVKARTNDDTILSFIPVNIISATEFLNDETFREKYIKDFLKQTYSLDATDIEYPLGNRTIKIGTMISIDGYKMWINGKMSGGTHILVTNAESLFFDDKWNDYIKRIDSYLAKKAKNKKILHEEEYDKLSESNNIALYELLIEKLNNKTFCNMPNNQGDTLRKGIEKFKNLGFDDQVQVLSNCINLMKTNRTGGCNLSLIMDKAGSGKNSGIMTLSAIYKKSKGVKYKDMRIIDTSPAGLHIVSTKNLLHFF